MKNANIDIEPIRQCDVSSETEFETKYFLCSFKGESLLELLHGEANPHHVFFRYLKIKFYIKTIAAEDISDHFALTLL